MDKKLVIATLLGCMLSSVVCAAPIDDAARAAAQADPGREMQRTQEMLERARVQQQIEEDRAKAKSKVEAGKDQGQKQEAPAVKVILKKIVTDPSRVLTDAELDTITKDYIGKEVSVKDLYAMVEKINKLYEQKGNITCRAFLQAQTLKDGVLKVTLIEGRNGKTTLEGNKWTKENYIKNRMHLKEGEIPTIQQMNEDLIWFNATNDCQLRMQLQAGEAPGTTDYVLQISEPQKYNITIFSDNAGNESTGLYRFGAYYTVRSLSGERDALTLGTIESRGMGSFSANYSRPIGLKGTKLNLAYSNNGVEQVENLATGGLYTKGHATSYSIGFSQPWIVTEKTRSEVYLDFVQQNSVSDFRNPDGSVAQDLIDDTYKDVNLGFALTNYGKSSVIYHRHTLTFGKKKHNMEGYGEDPNYTIYRLNGLYQKVYKHGQMITARGDFQKASNSLKNVSSKGFYIGGMNSVRGYKESFLGFSDGLNLSLEYSVPVSEDRLCQAYVFADYGHGYGEAIASNGIYRRLASVGIGYKSTIDEHIFLNISIARALKTDFSGAAEKEVNRYRANFLISGQF